MKIIKQGDLDKAKDIVQFECRRCGCVFKAEKGEWAYAPQIAQQRGEATYVCTCPCCGHNVCK